VLVRKRRKCRIPLKPSKRALTVYPIGGKHQEKERNETDFEFHDRFFLGGKQGGKNA
jgi:hypothetical protein